MKQTYLMLGVAAVVAAAACAKPPVPLQPRPVVNADSIAQARQDSLDRARRDSVRKAELARQEAEADSLKAAREQEQRNAAADANAMSVLKAEVYFDYDSSGLTDAAVALLQAKIPVLQSHTALHVLITGNTDNRGSTEYNMALGLRRASSVKAWLVNHGIDASRLSITSMGAETPAAEGEGEEVWSKNRRCEFEPKNASESEPPTDQEQ